MDSNSTTSVAQQAVTPLDGSANGVLLTPFTAPAAIGAPAPAKPSVEQLVEDWFRKHFHGLGARVDESLYNHLHAAKEELKQLLARV